MMNYKMNEQLFEVKNYGINYHLFEMMNYRMIETGTKDKLAGNSTEWRKTKSQKKHYVQFVKSRIR